jgi:DNA-binding transcriptional regulator PaaX
VGEEQSLALSAKTADGEQRDARIQLEGKGRDDVLHSLSNALRRHAREEQRVVWVRPKAEPGRPAVYRVDANEPEQLALPPRARLQSVTKAASARLPLNASFRVTLKQPPMPERLLPEEDVGQRDSVMRFDSGGRQQVW